MQDLIKLNLALPSIYLPKDSKGFPECYDLSKYFWNKILASVVAVLAAGVVGKYPK